MTGKEYDHILREHVSKARIDINQKIREEIRHRYARKQIKRMFVWGMIVLCGVVIGPHAWSYIEFQAHSFSNWMALHGKEIR